MGVKRKGNSRFVTKLVHRAGDNAQTTVFVRAAPDAPLTRPVLRDTPPTLLAQSTKLVAQIVTSNSPGGPPRLKESPEKVAEWWNGLTADQQHQVERDYGHMLGNKDGIPYLVRDRVNRRRLAEDEKLAEQGLLGDEELPDTIRATRDALNMPGRKRTLVLYRPRENNGKGHIAVGCGDLDTAETVTVVVPGFRSTVARRIESLVENTDMVLDSADHWVWLNGETPSHAGVAWIGYSSPTLRQLPTLAPARWGAKALTEFVEGVSARPRQEINVVAHSYGGVVATLAAQSPHITRVVCAGAPGVAFTTPPADSTPVFTISARHDPVGVLGWFDSVHKDHVTTVDLPDEDAVGEGKTVPTGHQKYFARGTVTVDIMGALTVGRNPQVRTLQGNPRGKLARLVDRPRRLAKAHQA